MVVVVMTKPKSKRGTLSSLKKPDPNEDDDDEDNNGGRNKQYDEESHMDIYVYYEDNDDESKEQDEEERRNAEAMKVVDKQNEPMSISQLIEKILSVLIFLFSGLIISLISIDNQVRVEWTVISSEIYIIWLIISESIKAVMRVVPTLKKNSSWYSVLVSGINSVSIVGFYLVAQFLVDIFKDSWRNSNLDVMETITALIVLWISFCGVLITLGILNV